MKDALADRIERVARAQALAKHIAEAHAALMAEIKTAIAACRKAGDRLTEVNKAGHDAGLVTNVWNDAGAHVERQMSYLLHELSITYWLNMSPPLVPAVPPEVLRDVAAFVDKEGR